MRFITTSLIVTTCAITFASGAPTHTYSKRDAATDILVLQFADVLEQLETQFYTEALAKFQVSDFQAAGYQDVDAVVQLLQVNQADEKTHSTALQDILKALGAEPVTSCVFNFDSVLTSVDTTMATARVVENTGVGAYLGGSAVVSPLVASIANTILTAEARHQTVLNIFAGKGSIIPNAFDLAMLPQEVLAIAGGFISGCDLGIPSNPPLSITNTGTVNAGTLLNFSSPALNGTVDPSTLSCQMMTGGALPAQVFPLTECVVPLGLNGPVNIYITTDGQPLLTGITDRATNTVFAGPTMAFIDSTNDKLSGDVRSSTPVQSSETTVTTTTISPGEASSIISMAQTDVVAGYSSPIGSA